MSPPTLLLEQARSAFARHAPEQGGEYLRCYLRHHPDDLQAWLFFAQKSLESEELGQARYVLERLARLVVRGVELPRAEKSCIFSLLVRCCIRQYDLRAARFYAEQCAKRLPEQGKMLEDLFQDDRPTHLVEQRSSRRQRNDSPRTVDARACLRDSKIGRFLRSLRAERDQTRPLFYDLVAADGPPLPDRGSG